VTSPLSCGHDRGLGRPVNPRARRNLALRLTNGAVANRDLGFDYAGTYLEGCAHSTVGGPLRKEVIPRRPRCTLIDVSCNDKERTTVANASCKREGTLQRCCIKAAPGATHTRDPSLVFIERLERWALAIAARNPSERARIRLIANI